MGTFLGNKVLQKSKFSKKFINKSWSPNQIFFTEKKIWKDDFEITNFAIFEKVVHNFGKSDDVTI